MPYCRDSSAVGAAVGRTRVVRRGGIRGPGGCAERGPTRLRRQRAGSYVLRYTRAPSMVRLAPLRFDASDALVGSPTSRNGRLVMEPRSEPEVDAEIDLAHATDGGRLPEERRGQRAAVPGIVRF